MDKKKIIIIAIVLLFGLGTFVFANPDDELEENNVNNSDTYLRDDNDLEDNNDSKISTNEKKVEDIDINNNNNNLQNVLSNTVFSNTNQYFNGNNQLNNSNQFPNNNNGNNSNNGGNNNNNNNNNGDNGNKPILPDKPDEKPDLPLVEDLSELQKLVDNLKVKVENATKREDIISAKDFRDKNKINESVLKIEDNDARYELQSILNNLNKILDDNTKPEIIGIKNLEFTNKNVSLTIKEDSIKKILLNDMDIINDQDILKSISEENTYTLVVIDNSFNEEKITFTIDKTSPVTEVTTSNSGQITNSNVTVYIKANEELQNISGWKLSNDKKMLSKEFSDNTNGEQILEVRDLAGNKTEVRYEVINIKNNKPTVDEKNIVYSTKELTNGDVVVTIKVSKPVFAPEGWTPSEGYTVFTKTFTKNEKEIVLLRDVLGNTNVINIVVDNIDKDLPIANIEYSVNPNIKTNKNIDVYIKLNEKVKKPVDEAWKLSEDALSIKKTFSKNTLSEELVEIEDLAGNKVIIPIEVKNIDKNLDGIIVKTSNDDVSTNSDVTVYIISPKELNEVSGWTLSKDKKTLSKVFDKTTIGVVEVTNIDGNNYAVGYEVKNLDKVPPVVKNSDVIYEEANDGGVIVTFKVSKSIFAPDEGWQAKEGYTVFTKKYMKNVDEILCLRDIYGNTSTLHINVNISAINEINEYVQANSTIFSDLVNKIFI